MGYRYIWIDSLCIIQDDEKDWQTESGNMCSIFQNAALVVAATLSADAGGGCFSSDHYHDSLSHMAVNDLIPIAPLLKRGWVFREGLLASRVSHFLHGELIWECNTEGLCECSDWKLGCKPTVVNQNPSPDEIGVTTAYHKLVEDYSCLSLTFASDKLPGISGVLKQFHSLREDLLGDYLAGLWRKTLIFDLAW
ncbi:HET-domain-containing protein, partial [Glonium stellatum]